MSGLIVLALTACAAAAPASPPNILFIAVDDLRPELGCYGNSIIKSPNIDRLAKRGVVFDRAYCQQAVCNASRASLLTGLRPDTTKVWDLITPMRTTIPDVVTLPQHFKQNGYYAVGMGKIYHNIFPDPLSWTIPQQPQPKGEFREYSAEVQKQADEMRAQAKQAGKTENQINRTRGPATEDEDCPDNQRFDGALGDLALVELKKAKEQSKPFFFAVGFIRPHLPFTPPRKYWDLYDPAKIPLAENPFLPHGAPAVAFGDASFGGTYEVRDYLDYKKTPTPFEGSFTEAQARRLKHGYYASVSFTDTQIGRVLDELDRLGVADNTIIVLWGDHGWKLGEHNGWCKQTNYEIDTRIPLIIVQPGAKANGQRCASLVEYVDLYPTLCELAGLPPREGLQGKSLGSLLQDPAKTVKAAAFSQFPRLHKGVKYMGYAMRTDGYRYVEWLEQKTAEVAATELYDETTDPQENSNIAADPARAALIKQLNAQLWTDLQKPAPGAGPTLPATNRSEGLRTNPAMAAADLIPTDSAGVIIGEDIEDATAEVAPDSELARQLALRAER